MKPARMSATPANFSIMRTLSAHKKGDEYIWFQRMKAGQDSQLQNGKTHQARQAENYNHSQGI